MELVSIEIICKIGAAIKRRRNELFWSQEKLGSMVRVSGKQIQRYESGENTISADKLHEISIALAVPITYFYPEESSQTAKQPTEYNKISPEIKDSISDFVRISAKKEGESAVPALRLENCIKLTPILLVDDDEAVLSITKLFLECEGYRNLHLIQDSRLVIQFLKKTRVSIIVLDLIMPHILGNELLFMLRNDFPRIQVIIMTAIEDMCIAKDCKKLGAFEFLVKPVDPPTLLSAVERTINTLIGHHIHGVTT